ncbi:MAG: PIN domain-containing protein [Saprospiraceae bacterium]|nr:PIN domain-containing protein [Saprospiraceae bacterium]
MIFLDTDILLDVAWQRDPFYIAAADLLTMIHEGSVRGGTTPVVLTNLYYLLSKENSDELASGYISRLLEMLEFIPVHQADFTLAMTSKFKDKEDAINSYAAHSAGCQTIITRNVRDFNHAGIAVMTAEEFIAHHHMHRGV